MPDVRKLFGDLFAYILFFEQTLLEGKSQPRYEQVHDQISALLDKQDAAAESEAIPNDDNQDARFAVVAWIDEMILKQSIWQGRAQWERSPLQLEYFKTWNAGVELFDRLRRLRPEQKEVREVYYLCLSLGFRGQYRNDEPRVIQILRDQAPHLLRPVEDFQAINKLTPQPYSVPAPNGKQPWSLWTRCSLNAGLWGLVSIPLVLFLGLRLVSQNVISHPTPLTQLSPTLPINSQLSQENIQKILEPYQQCANISVDFFDPQKRVVSLGGRTVSDSQRADIRKAVQSVPGGLQVNDTLEIIPHLFCKVLEVLEPLRNPVLRVSLNKSTEDGRPAYYAGENLVIHVTTPPKFENYLYVDYFSSQADVAHLFPNDFEKTRLFAPDTSYTVGDPQRVRILIKPPSGLELITVITSRRSLFPMQRPFTEPAESYLKELRQLLSPETSNPDAAAMFYFFTNQSH